MTAAFVMTRLLQELLLVLQQALAASPAVGFLCSLPAAELLAAVVWWRLQVAAAKLLTILAILGGVVLTASNIT